MQGYTRRLNKRALSAGLLKWRDRSLSGRREASPPCFRGTRLAVAEEWAASHSDELSKEEAELLRCSREAHEQWKATELEAAQRLARAEAQRAEEAEGRSRRGWFMLVLCNVCPTLYFPIRI
jgi:hypothetical protein